MKSWGPGISPDYYECAPPPPPPDRKLKATIEPKEIPRCLIPPPTCCITWQLEILVTALYPVYWYVSVNNKIEFENFASPFL